MAAPRFSTPIKPQFHLGPITVPRLVRWTPILAVWGTAAVGAGFLFLSPIPLFQHDVLLKIPGIASYYKDTTPDADKPF